jgi:hypothetical protein
LIFRGSLQRVELSLKEVLNFGFWRIFELLSFTEMDWMHFELWDRCKPFGDQGWNVMV